MRDRGAVLLVTLFLTAVAPAAERFISPTLNFSIVMPTEEWSWTPSPPPNSVEARAAGGEQLTVWASGAEKRQVDHSWVREVLRDAAVKAAADGARIEGTRIELATSPIQPSYRFSYVRVEKDGERRYVYGYTAAAGRAYVLQFASPDRQSRALFDAFVASFRVKDKVESLRGGGATRQPPATMVQNIDNPIGRPILPNAEAPGKPPR
ncbi:MAG TPA: hypothetical protein VGF28_06285 [Thermoanaerobaculia bacterium]|jgi:hypothetical protein